MLWGKISNILNLFEGRALDNIYEKLLSTFFYDLFLFYDKLFNLKQSRNTNKYI